MLPSTEQLTRLGRAPTAHRYVAGPVRAAAFWTAVLLPLSYFPLLWGGVAADAPLAFLALLVVNAVAAVVGHGYRAEADRRSRA